MKTLTAKVSMGLGAAGVTGAAATGAWYMSQSNDVKSQLISDGLTLVGESPRAWRAVFLAHKEDGDFISFAGISESMNDREAGSKVMSACKKVTSEDSGSKDYDISLSKAKKYCTTPELKTVEAKVLFSDHEISSEERDFRDIFILHKGDNSFVEKVKAVDSSTSSFDSNVGIDTAYSLVQKFCDSLKAKESSPSNVADYEKYCLQTPSNIQGFYESKGLTLVGDWAGKFESIKASDTNLVNDIKGSSSNLNQSSPSSEVGSKLEEWCKKEVVKTINSADPNSGENSKVKTRCFN
ncbi:hypothetical protein HF1_12120 [Mycoplasma haemofelis str. Langford 1]|uniref:Lipoprotein n=1 Tax=Mycoplasma haemofelis (strain Langford 1) TaxID=941640 RepID=E8ZJ99_MYCHL|nr:hypothetical protein [Mycoplasma haemofelis]CBY93220.1 hypothetical protein HF1_12120 [Mycoplasma haemofelis str. Langford 1]